jgi:dTDP-glucose 4,6-dehydratase
MKKFKKSDLEEIVQESETFLSSFSGKKILVAGATGFVGSWLISVFEFANRQMNTNIDIFALARNIPQDFRSNFPQVSHFEGNVADFNFGIQFNPDCIINAATPSVAYRGSQEISQILTGSISGTKNLLRYCSNDVKTLFINLSSGIVSKRESEVELDLSLPKDAYLHGKRQSEELVTRVAQSGRIIGKNLRLYAFAGPGISLTDHFAVGNFLADAISSRPINIKGNPNTVRSYLYPTDLIINILNQAINIENEPIELGSFNRITMRNLAEVVNIETGNIGILEPNQYGTSDEYVPQSTRIKITQNVDISDSISRWVKWLKN